MTAKPDLAALARELEALRAFVNEHVAKDGYAHLTAQSREALNMPLVLSEPLPPSLSEPAAEADAHPQEARIYRCYECNEETNESLRAQLESAAPLFEAAHKYEASYIGSVVKGNELLSAAEAWARSKHGQLWKASRG